MKTKSKVSPRGVFYLIAIAIIIISMAVSFVALAKVSALNREQQIQITENDYNVLCLVSQMVDENITPEVLDVISATDKDIQSAVFELYPKEFAAACDLMRITDEALRLS